MNQWRWWSLHSSQSNPNVAKLCLAYDSSRATGTSPPIRQGLPFRLQNSVTRHWRVWNLNYHKPFLEICNLSWQAIWIGQPVLSCTERSSDCAKTWSFLHDYKRPKKWSASFKVKASNFQTINAKTRGSFYVRLFCAIGEQKTGLYICLSFFFGCFWSSEIRQFDTSGSKECTCSFALASTMWTTIISRLYCCYQCSSTLWFLA